MTTCHVLASGTVELLFYGELSGDRRLATEQHLSSCAECRAAFEELVEIREALASVPGESTPPGGDWSGFMLRLDQAVAGIDGHPGATTGSAVASDRRWVPLLAMAALLALVTMSVVSLVVWRSQAPGDLTVAGKVVGPDVPAPVQAALSGDAAFAALTEQHLERSKLVVFKLASRGTDGDAGSSLDYERRLASTLLGDTRLYRLTAEQRGLTSVARVMGDLELVLLQTSMSEQLDADAVGQIQRLIRKRDLVTKMNAVAMAGGM
ncbi:MAG TPA: zf-HC2 domain-containing protein [Vicinamibacterales bacterium]|nr:zf-HC2 domain-containing protein [Vicinamibacterales bacterium]